MSWDYEELERSLPRFMESNTRNEERDMLIPVSSHFLQLNFLLFSFYLVLLSLDSDSSLLCREHKSELLEISTAFSGPVD